jgi:sortase A
MTLAWQEPLSTIYGSIQQGRAEDELAELEEAFPSIADAGAVESQADLRRQARLLADRYEDEVSAGTGIGRIEIESANVDAVIVEGTGTATLQKGPGRYPETAFPGQGRTVGIAGHRTTYGAPFRHIDDIEDGDEIEVQMPYANFTYEVSKHEVVEPSDVQIIDDVGYEQLVLTACHPLYSAAQRWAVFARLVEVSLPANGG